MIARIPRWAKICFASLTVTSLLLIAYVGFLQLSGNFHEVVPGQLYRSAQLSAEQITYYQKEFGIRSIINLRGENNGKKWYDQEVAASRDLGIAHLNFKMSAKHMVSQDDAEKLIAIMRAAPKPLLIHCQAGADRSGLAASLYLAAIEHADEDRSETQLSLKYGHFSVPWFSQAYPMDESWEILEPWLGYKDS